MENYVLILTDKWTGDTIENFELFPKILVERRNISVSCLVSMINKVRKGSDLVTRSHARFPTVLSGKVKNLSERTRKNIWQSFLNFKSFFICNSLKFFPSTVQKNKCLALRPWPGAKVISYFDLIWCEKFFQRKKIDSSTLNSISVHSGVGTSFALISSVMD